MGRQPTAQLQRAAACRAAPGSLAAEHLGAAVPGSECLNSITKRHEREGPCRRGSALPAPHRAESSWTVVWVMYHRAVSEHVRTVLTFDHESEVANAKVYLPQLGFSSLMYD